MKADDYKKLGFYESKTTNISNSFGKFSDENEHYFCYNSDKGYAILISEAYSSESGRDNGIKSVQKNMTNPDRYVRQTTDAGKHYFSLRAGNNQEIAMSRQFGSTGEMNQAIGKLTGEGGVIAAAGAVDTDNITAAGEGYTANFSIAAPAPTPTDAEDKPKKKRKKKTGPKKPKPERVELKKGKYLFNDVTYKTFRSGEDKHYFMFNDSNDKMLFMTTNLKGFPTEKQVDEALAKAIELAPSEANYEGKVAKNGTYYFYLKDADGKNFGKSFFYKQEEDMRQAVGLLIGRVAGAGAPADVVDADAGAKAAAAAETARLKAEADAKAKADANAKRKADETARLKAEADAKAKAEADAKRKADEAARLKAEADAKAKADAEAKRKADEAARLKAEADAKAARLKAEQQKKAAAAAAAAAAATALALKQKSDAAAKEEKERKALRSDDYLPCKEYGGKTGFNKFHNAERNQHYFAYNDRNGNTLLRSEGYTTEAARDNGLRSVIKNSPSDQNWKTEVALGKYHYYVLRAGNNQEIARSCYYESKDEMMAAYNGVTGENSAIGIGSALVGGKLLSAAMLRRRSQEEEADAKRKANEAARLKAEADAKAKADAEAARLKAEAEDKRKADEAARLKAEADAKAKADAEAARLKAEAEAKRKANEAARLKAEQDKKAAAAAAAAAAASALAFRQKEEANAKAKAEQARLRAEADAKRKAEADAKAKADAEAARLKAEAEAKRKADETARLKAEQDKKAAAAAAAAAASALAFRQKEEANAKAKAEQARLRAEADAKRKAEADAKAKADAQAAKLKAEAETKRKADEAARLKSDQDRKAAAAAAATAAAAAAASALALRRKEEVNAKAEEARLKTEAKAKAEADAARLKAEAKAEAIRLRTEETPGKAKIEATAKPKPERVVATAAAASTGGGTSKKVSATTPVDDGAGLGGCLRKWWWLALLLLLLPLLFFLIRGCGGAVAACDVPDVRIQGTNNTTVQLATANIAADISNVDKENINVTFNNKPIDNFTYNEDNDKFGINLALISGKNTLRINAKNECGEDTETRTITYQEKSTFIGKNCTDLGFNKNSLSCNMANYMAAGASTFPKMFTFDRSRFGQNSAKMPNSAYRDVDEMATLLKAYPNAKIDIHGYIDTNESEACNESYCEGANLSTVRARCLYRKLLDRGISANQMTFKGMGTKAGKKIEIFIQNR